MWFEPCLVTICNPSMGHFIEDESHCAVLGHFLPPISTHGHGNEARGWTWPELEVGFFLSLRFWPSNLLWLKAMLNNVWIYETRSSIANNWEILPSSCCYEVQPQGIHLHDTQDSTEGRGEAHWMKGNLFCDGKAILFVIKFNPE